MTITRLLAKPFKRTTATGTISAEVVVPADERWLISAVGIHYTCNDQAGTRIVIVELEVGGEVEGGVESDVTMIADDELRYWFAPGLVSSSDSKPAGPTTAGVATEPIPEFVAEPGDIIRGRARAGGDAGDVCSVSVHAQVQLL